MNTITIIYPLFAQVLWSASLYALLTLARAPAIWGLGVHSGLFKRLRAIEPRISANLSNQFEWPLLFYVAVVLQVVLQTTLAAPTSSSFIVLAWLFVVGRVLHSGVQIFTANIRLRGIVFCVNFLAVLGLWALLAIQL